MLKHLHNFATSMFALGFVNVASVSGAVIFVDGTAPAGGNGQSWQSAFRSPHQALKVAQAGDQIRIAKGLYRPAGANGNRFRSFKLKEGVIIQGGYAGLTQPNPNLLNPTQFITRLSGDLNKNDANSQPGSGAFSENSYHVLVAQNISRDTILRGLVISGGNANSPDPNSNEQRGGGLLCIGDTGPTIDKCTIERNFAQFQGAGMYSDGNPLIKSSTFRKNKSNYNGAGAWMENGVVKNSKFVQNSGANQHSGGGGIFGNKLNVTNCTFKQNASGAIVCGDQSFVRNCHFEDNFSEDGGAMFIFDGDVAVVECDFLSNGAASFGGAIMSNWESAATVLNCRFAGNSAWVGSAVYDRGSLLAANCTFTGNYLPFSGSESTICNRAGDMQLINCTIAHNFNAQPGAAVMCDTGAAISLHNCVIWGNESDAFRNEFTQILIDSSADIQNCCIEGWSGAMGGQDTFAANPQLINPSGPDGVVGTLDDNVRLGANSPCIDAGLIALLPDDEFDLDDDGNEAEPISLDIDSSARIVGPSVDLGASEAP